MEAFWEIVAGVIYVLIILVMLYLGTVELFSSKKHYKYTDGKGHIKKDVYSNLKRKLI